MPGGLVPLITNYGAAESLYAPASGGGGGGGGGGANLSVSSIAVIAGGQINMNASASAIGTLNMEYNSTINQGSQIAFQVDQGIGGFIGMGYDNVTSTVAVTYISETGGASGGLGMSFDIGLISSLTVSSINGASPGGGGGANPNPSFSSISLSTSANVNMLGGGFIQVLGNDVGLNIQNNTTTAVNEIGMITNGTASAVYPNLTGNGTYISLSAPSANGGLTMFAGDNEGQFIIGSGVGQSTLTIISGGELRLITAPGAPTSLSTLNVSSINGAAPGGGAGNNPAFSTVYVSSFVSADALIANTRLDAPAVGGAVSTAALRLEADNVGSHIVYISTGQNMTELKFAQTYIQVVGDLQVSSINGAVPGSVTNTSTGSLAQSFVLAPGGAPVTAITGAFNTTAGNLYNISWQDTVAANGLMAPNSFIEYSISSSAGFLPLDVVQGVPISSFAISSLLSHNYLFKAEGATGQLVVTPNVMPSTLINLVAGQDIIVRDLGAVV